MGENRHRILEKALNILELVAKEEEGPTFSQITTALNLANSTSHSLLATFVDMGYLEKDEDTLRYRIGLKAFEVGVVFSQKGGVFKYMDTVLKELVEEVDETAHIAALDNTDIVYMAKHDCSHAVRMISQIGKRVPAHATAIGKAILTNKSEEALKQLYPNQLLPALTENTISSRAALEEELDKIRKTGFSTEKEESTPGIQCIAVAVKNDRIQKDIAISIAVPIPRVQGGMQRFKEPILKAKRKLEAL